MNKVLNNSYCCFYQTNQASGVCLGFRFESVLNNICCCKSSTVHHLQCNLSTFRLESIFNNSYCCLSQTDQVGKDSFINLRADIKDLSEKIVSDKIISTAYKSMRQRCSSVWDSQFYLYLNFSYESDFNKKISQTLIQILFKSEFEKKFRPESVLNVIFWR